MTWFKVSDDAHSNPKLRLAGRAGRSLWILAGSWCSDHLTDGKVPVHMLPFFDASADDAAALVDAGLWEMDDSGFRFVNWERYQPSCEDELKKRAKAVVRMTAVRANKKRSGDVRANTTRSSLNPDPDPDPNSSLLSLNPLREIETSLSSENTHGFQNAEPSQHAARIAGYCWLNEFLGGAGAPDQHVWRVEYEKIGFKSTSERLAVAKNMRASRWVAEKPSRATPKHVVAYWQQYLEGPRNFEAEQPVKKPKYAMPEVASREAFAFDAAHPEVSPW